MKGRFQLLLFLTLGICRCAVGASPSADTYLEEMIGSVFVKCGDDHFIMATREKTPRHLADYGSGGNNWVNYYEIKGFGFQSKTKPLTELERINGVQSIKSLIVTGKFIRLYSPSHSDWVVANWASLHNTGIEFIWLPWVIEQRNGAIDIHFETGGQPEVSYGHLEFEGYSVSRFECKDLPKNIYLPDSN